ncbi:MULTISPECIES: flagellar biosynthesis protein FlhA [unclassified Nitratiruptor]|uniref:flagellar biosynthesis protein FlhA n=1 Tax=unclassified Nitratiruptor TaxID=2624044 RepID=UPI001915CE08|nr:MULTISPECIES: flagellar biosynthesis protein FlhA [unclassified Nitratiruptor]BCD59915.1 flagellar biosynthesis protein FlhA [Nitratiruptor sp. YY08-10]BCD63838.1 flagellar biosynthesis protein FlhA [Nitratiruptor sp. YY08-14]
MTYGIEKIFSKVHEHSDAIIIVLILAILASMILPVPPFFLDLLLTASITFSLVILMTTVYVGNPLEIASFPSLLLLATLFRLALNIATTRRILLHGHEGPEAAGKLIESFGQFVVGGNYIVGIIIFIILVTINFIVVTKGTERISEVGARFTLDAMPGKQMAIDADLNAGLIDEQEARRRREAIAKEADFYGAMDGASKFIRGDAIAGIIITTINIIGGIAIGVLQHGMDLSTAVANFTLLTVGDGLVSQIPSLITSTAAGLMVTRAVSETNLGKEIFSQLTSYPKALYMTAGALFVIGTVPGMPFVPFTILAGMIALTAYMMQLEMKRETIEKEEEEVKEILQQQEEEREEEFIAQPETITFEIGYALIPLVDEDKGGELLKRIKSLRKQLSKELGLMVPLIHIKDNLELKSGEYRILLKGVEVARYEIQPGKMLAIDTGQTNGKLEGVETKEPTFGLKAYWIDESQKDKARMLGFTVVDIPTVIITHLSEIIKQNAHEILGRSETKELVDKLAQKYPIVKEIVPEQVPYSVLHRVLQNLLREHIPIKDLLTIIESLSDNITKTEDTDILTELVRESLARLITSIYAKDGVLYALTLDPASEEKLYTKIKEYNGNLPPIDPAKLQNFIMQISKNIEKFVIEQRTPVLLTSPNVRRYVHKIIEPYLSNVAVLSYNEVDPKTKLKIIDKVSLDGNS